MREELYSAEDACHCKDKSPLPLFKKGTSCISADFDLVPRVDLYLYGGYLLVA